ncbi:MAG: GntR family transcriptional regulator [Hyphomonadaceae bacterium]|nr:GntR family transcriptional regulator [Hyphomonadaceae bacterium]
MEPQSLSGHPRKANDQSTSLQQQAYLLLKRMIESGRIQPGERLLESQVAKAFGVSRSPARKALEVLCQQRLIQEQGARGYCIPDKTRSKGSGRLAVIEPIRLALPRQWERIYGKVEQALIAGILFGSIRINDLRLAQHYGVSRTVTRDLLVHMHGVGLISKDRSGHWLAERVTPDRIRDLYELRQFLEPQALLRAAPYIPQALLVKARENVEATLARSPIDSLQFDQVEIDLHLDILGLSPNKEVLRALRRTHILFGPTRHLFDPILGIPIEMIQDALHEHLEIINLLSTKKPAQAARRLSRHLEDAVDRWLGRFEVSARMKKIELPPYLTLVSETEK